MPCSNPFSLCISDMLSCSGNSVINTIDTSLLFLTDVTKMALTSLLFSEWHLLCSRDSASFLQQGGQWRRESYGWRKNKCYFFVLTIFINPVRDFIADYNF